MTSHDRATMRVRHALRDSNPCYRRERNTRTSKRRMVEKHYGHLAPSYIADAIRAGAPRFGTAKDARVVAIGR